MSHLDNESILKNVPTVEGFKVLDPVALYSRLGEGGMATVFHGRHLNLGIDVAVKCLKVHGGAGDSYVARFAREARVAAEISSENLVRVYDVREMHGIHYLIMEFVLGESLRSRVVRKGRLDVAEALSIVSQAARGLDAAHVRGIIHRDVKPDNILISRQGTVKVADLGLAKAAEAIDSLVTGTHAMMGTPQFMPPEQFGTAADVGTQADVYALAATLYFLLSGRNPFESGSLSELMKRVCVDRFPSIQDRRADVPAALIELLEQSTEKDPARRPTDAAEFARRVDAVLSAAGGPVPLGDPAAGLVSDQSLISPPPAEILSAMKLAIARGETTRTWRESGHLETAAVSNPPKTLTIGSRIPTALIPSLAGRRRGVALVVPIIAGVLALAGGVIGVKSAWTRLVGPSAEEIQARLGDVAQRMAGEGGARVAIAELREILGDVPGNLAAEQLLGEALGRQADASRRVGALGDALDAALEAVEYGDTQEGRARVQQILGALTEALSGSMQLVSPSPGAALQKAPEDLSFSIGYDHTAIERVSVNGADLGARRGAFEVAGPPDAEGQVEVVMEVFAKGGVTATRRFAFTVDSLPPEFASLSVHDGQVVGPTWTLTGELRDASPVTLAIDGAPVEVTDGGRFEVQLGGEAGPVNHELVATDRLGHVRRRTLPVAVDDRRPSIVLTGPGRVISKDGRYAFVAEVRDDHGIRELRCGTMVFDLPESGPVRGEIRLVPGENQLAFLATDLVGNQDSAPVTVIWDDEDPQVQVVHPREGEQVAVGPIVVSGICQDRTACTVLWGTREATVIDGRFEVTVEVDGDGIQELLLQVTDAAGNSVDVTLRVDVRHPCRGCQGDGRCSACDGEGHAGCKVCAGTTVARMSCNACRGSGCASCLGSKVVGVSCGACGGSGGARCGFCNGAGFVRNPLGKKFPQIPCLSCAGGGARCGTCGGSGTSSRPCACAAHGPSGTACAACGGQGSNTATCHACVKGRSRASCTSCGGDGRCRSCAGTGTRPAN